MKVCVVGVNATAYNTTFIISRARTSLLFMWVLAVLSFVTQETGKLMGNYDDLI